jgi:DNA (cytosine-5)-methyltransferase 1
MEQDVFKRFICDLKRTMYKVSVGIVDCLDYGIPQHRQRLVLLASRLGPIRLLSPTEIGAERTTVRDKIAHLPPLEAGEIHKEDQLHQASALSLLNLKRIKASLPGGTWARLERNTGCRLSQEEIGKDLSECLR